MWYQQQLQFILHLLVLRCDLLKNIYLCGINNNFQGLHPSPIHVVICLKISTFVVSTTTSQKQNLSSYGCDLLENIYLCGINNNYITMLFFLVLVVICLKISTFVVSTTTGTKVRLLRLCCDLLENIYLCGINNNITVSIVMKHCVVICLKISTFVVSTTT